MITHAPIIIFAAGALVVTGIAAWVVRAVVHIGRAAARFPKEHTP